MLTKISDCTYLNLNHMESVSFRDDEKICYIRMRGVETPIQLVGEAYIGINELLGRRI